MLHNLVCLLIYTSLYIFIIVILSKHVINKDGEDSMIFVFIISSVMFIAVLLDYMLSNPYCIMYHTASPHCSVCEMDFRNSYCIGCGASYLDSCVWYNEPMAERFDTWLDYLNCRWTFNLSYGIIILNVIWSTSVICYLVERKVKKC